MIFFLSIFKTMVKKCKAKLDRVKENWVFVLGLHLVVCRDYSWLLLKNYSCGAEGTITAVAAREQTQLGYMQVKSLVCCIYYSIPENWVFKLTFLLYFCTLKILRMWMLWEFLRIYCGTFCIQRISFGL